VDRRRLPPAATKENPQCHYWFELVKRRTRAAAG
jgi:hypothetical protein